MSDWQPGDLALCVNTSCREFANSISVGGQYLRVGAIYSVISIAVNPANDVPNLILSEVKSPCLTGGFGHWRFRKINPHTPDAEDEETLRLLTGTDRVREDV